MAKKWLFEIFACNFLNRECSKWPKFGFVVRLWQYLGTERCYFINFNFLVIFGNFKSKFWSKMTKMVQFRPLKSQKSPINQIDSNFDDFYIEMPKSHPRSTQFWVVTIPLRKKIPQFCKNVPNPNHSYFNNWQKNSKFPKFVSDHPPSPLTFNLIYPLMGKIFWWRERF